MIILEKNYSFIDCYDLLIDFRNFKYTNYYILGFPASKKQTKYNQITKTIKGKAFHYPTTLIEDLKVYQKYKMNYNEFILLKYDYKNFSKGSQTKIKLKLNGISGCGVWVTPKEFLSKDEKKPLKLIGLIIEEEIGKQSYLIAIRINIIIEMVNKLFNLNIFNPINYNFKIKE